MKSYYWFLLLFIFPITAYSQDLILLNDMSSVFGKIIRVSSDSITYLVKKNSATKEITLSKKQLMMIHFYCNDYDSLDSPFKTLDLPFKKSWEKATINTVPDDGPRNAIYSLIFPGWGTLKVRQTQYPYWITGIISYGFLGTAYILSDKSKNLYHSYMREGGKSSTFQKANKLHHYSLALYGVGLSIWLGDVLFTTIKGCKNRKAHHQGTFQTGTKISFSLSSEGLVGLSFHF